MCVLSVFLKHCIIECFFFLINDFFNLLIFFLSFIPFKYETNMYKNNLISRMEISKSNEFSKKGKKWRWYKILTRFSQNFLPLKGKSQWIKNEFIQPLDMKKITNAELPREAIRHNSGWSIECIDRVINHVTLYNTLIYNSFVCYLFIGCSNLSHTDTQLL